ncbi:hypothetical protein B0T21DRAFT_364911 [Apiosordaria backusii]|uniref:Uncharacterized protein n=1 Tax=Apiosordaria backusii TaxID=314023 RepID=A0AA40EGA6_9PEZI|nr:hypothetical protein B0T21DRAFT_364911 [Apiosordaria backusii]
MARGLKSGSYISDAPLVFAVSAIVEGLVTLALASIFVFSILRISTRSRPIWYFYATMSTLFIGYTLRMASFSVYAYYDKPEVYLSFEDRYLFMLLSAKRLEPVARLFRHLGAALCSVTLVELGQRYIWGSNQRTPLQIGRAAVWTSAGVASALALTHCILAQREIDPDLMAVERLGLPRVPRLDEVFNGNRVVAVVICAALLVLFAGGIAVLGMAIYASCITPGEEKRAAASVDISLMLVVASVILVIVRGWNMAEVHLLLNPYRRVQSKHMDWWYWCELVLDRVATSLILLLVYNIGKKASVLDTQ